MFSKEERLKAVQLLIQYDMMYSKVIVELGYPNKMTLRLRPTVTIIHSFCETFPLPFTMSHMYSYAKPVL